MVMEVVPMTSEERDGRSSLFDELEAKKVARRRELRNSLLADPGVKAAMKLFELGERDVRFEIRLGGAASDEH